MLKNFKRLEDIIAGRPVILFASGPSLSVLESRIVELANIDICYIGMNAFHLVEKYILAKIGRLLDIIVVADNVSFHCYFKEICKFLSREGNLLLSRFVSAFELFPSEKEGFLRHHGNKVLEFDTTFERDDVPNKEAPWVLQGWVNTLIVLIWAAVAGRASRVYIFGADGGGDGVLYYRQDELCEEKKVSTKPLFRDTGWFNERISRQLKNIMSTFDSTVEIFNVSDNTLYKGFNVITIDNFFKGFQRFL
jgi:hypothetical protein